MTTPMPTPTTKRLVRGVVAGLLLAVGAACGTADPGPPTDVEDLPGVRDAVLERVTLDDDYYGYQAVVDMEPDATPAQIAAVLDELERWKDARDAPEVTTAVYLGAGSVDPQEAAWLDGAAAGIGTVRGPARNLAAAELLVTATSTLDLPVGIVEDEWQVVSPIPRETAGIIATHPDLAAVPDLVVHPPLPPVGTIAWDEPAAIGASPRLTPALLATYDQAVAAARLADRAQGAGASVRFVGNPSTRSLGEEYDEETGERIQPPAGAVDVLVDVRLPGGAGPRTLRPRLADDPLWPMVRAQLDLLRPLPPGSRLWVSLQFTRPGGLAYDAGRSLVEVTRGEDPSGRARTPWNLAAAAYLNR